MTDYTGDDLRRVRTARGVSANELAFKLQTTEATIYRYERGGPIKAPRRPKYFVTAVTEWIKANDK